MTPYQEWCKQNDCDHAHCPEDCEHPQPFMENGKLICGRCAVIDGKTTEMVACKPQTCKDARV